MKKAIFITAIVGTVFGLASCYKNYHDVSDTNLASINNVSFRKDIVPIMISGACGCHNNGSTRQIAFSRNDTVFYSAIQARAAQLDSMALGYQHPGEGSVYFSASQKELVHKWFLQGAKDDYTPPPITGDISYARNIVPLYQTDCKGGSCHGGTAITLDYTALKNDEATIKAMMNSYGSSGHPGGTLSIAQGTAATFLAWISQGYKP